MALGRRAVSVIRPSGAFDDDTGRWVESAVAPFTIQASVQPVSSRELEKLPEGRRTSGVFKMYTDFHLQAGDDKLGKNPDRVTFRIPAWDTTAPLRTYEVFQVGEFQSGIASHYKAMVSLLEQEPDGVAED